MRFTAPTFALAALLPSVAGAPIRPIHSENGAVATQIQSSADIQARELTGSPYPYTPKAEEWSQIWELPGLNMENLAPILPRAGTPEAQKLEEALNGAPKDVFRSLPGAKEPEVKTLEEGIDAAHKILQALTHWFHPVPPHPSYPSKEEPYTEETGPNEYPEAIALGKATWYPAPSGVDIPVHPTAAPVQDVDFSAGTSSMVSTAGKAPVEEEKAGKKIEPRGDYMWWCSMFTFFPCDISEVSLWFFFFWLIICE